MTHAFATMNQEDQIVATGRCYSGKGGNIEDTMWNDPNSDPI